MKYIMGIILSLFFTGCGFDYPTVADKDISLKVRSIWADVDYDSRVCEKLQQLGEFNTDGLTNLKELR